MKLSLGYSVQHSSLMCAVMTVFSVTLVLRMHVYNRPTELKPFTVEHFWKCCIALWNKEITYSALQYIFTSLYQECERYLPRYPMDFVRKEIIFCLVYEKPIYYIYEYVVSILFCINNFHKLWIEVLQIMCLVLSGL